MTGENHEHLVSLCFSAGSSVHMRWWVISMTGALSALSTDAAGELDILGHDGHPLGMDSCQVCVLKQTHQVGLSGLLQCQDRAALEAQVCKERGCSASLSNSKDSTEAVLQSHGAHQS